MDSTAPKAKLAYQIASRLKEQHFTALYAGGCVRDFFMHHEPRDIDIATTATPDDIERIFSHTVPVGRQFGVMIVLEEDIPFEVATFRCEGGYVDGRHPSRVEFSVPEEDAKRRDFTVNGLFYDPFQKKILDFVGGEEDLKRKLIRAIGDPEQRFEEDKLRLLRAVRFAANLNFEIEEKTWRAVCSKASLITQVSAERIRDELIKIFTRPGAAKGFDLLSSSGLMKFLLPEIEAMKGVQQQPEFHPEGDVFIHTRLLLEKLTDPSLTLAFGALFHDVGKPKTFEVRNGKITFYQHAPLGAEMTRQIMKRLRFSNDQIRDVAECVENHMKFADVQKMRSGKLKLFVSRPTFMEELELHRIDCQSSHGMLGNFQFLKKKLDEYSVQDLKPKPLINGHDLLEIGMKPGPKMKVILEGIYELQLEGKFHDKTQVLDYCKEILKGKTKDFEGFDDLNY